LKIIGLSFLLKTLIGTKTDPKLPQASITH